LLLADIEVLAGSPYAVSGHGSRDDLKELLRAAHPRALLPVHGTQRQIRAHAALAEEIGVPALRCRDGDVIEIGEAITVREHLTAAALCVEGSTIGAVGQETLRQRQRLSHTGVVAVAVDPQVPGRFIVSALGVSDSGPELDALCREAADSAATALQTFGKGQADAYIRDDRVRNAVTRAVRSTFARRRGVKPTILAVLAGPEVGYDEQDDASTEAAL
jgi:ribonuclease J